MAERESAPRVSRSKRAVNARFDRAVDHVLAYLSPYETTAFWAYVDGDISEEEFHDRF